MSGVTVSVVMPVRDMESTIAAQLAALAEQDFGAAWELVIADNDSSDGTVAVADEWRERLPMRIVGVPGQGDRGHAINVGAAAARGELLVFCDADDEVRPQWLGSMVDALQRNPLVVGGIEFARINPPDRAVAHEQDLQGIPWLRFLPAGLGANLGVRRSLFDELGGFPEGFRRCEEVAFCWNAQLAGHRLAFEPAAIIDYRLKRHSKPEAFRHYVREGVEMVRLYLAFRDRGMPRSPLRDIVYDYLSVPFWLARRQTYRAARIGGWRVGRLVGSLRWRVLYP